MAAAKAKAVRKDKKKEQTALKEKKPLKMDYKCVTLPYLIHMNFRGAWSKLTCVYICRKLCTD